MNNVQTHPQKFILLEHDPTHQNTQSVVNLMHETLKKALTYTDMCMYLFNSSTEINMQHKSICVYLMAASHFVFV